MNKYELHGFFSGTIYAKAPSALPGSTLAFVGLELAEGGDC